MDNMLSHGHSQCGKLGHIALCDSRIKTKLIISWAAAARGLPLTIRFAVTGVRLALRREYLELARG